VYLNDAQCRQLGFAAGDRLRVRQGEAALELPLAVDARVADGTAFIPSGIAGTQGLGAAYGAVTLERV
jgi:NADH-quinone oxidoreductase subunit G